MKRTYTINIDSRLLNIDEDAYEMLNDYQTTLRQVFSCQPDGLETLADLESRISEILSEQGPAEHIITKNEVENMINRLGLPEEMGIEQPAAQPTVKTRKRLYRDPADKKVAGVCAGIAAYLGCDPLWIRIATIIIFLLLKGAIALVYVIFWIFLPVADTTSARLQMAGTSPTLDNIAASVASRHNQQSEQRPDYSRFEKFCAGVTTFCAYGFKALMVFYGLVGLLTLFWSVVMTFVGGYVVYDLVSGSTLYFDIIRGLDIPVEFRDLLLNYDFALPLFVSIAGGAFATAVGITAIFITFFNALTNKPLLFNKATRIAFLTAFSIGIGVSLIGECIVLANHSELFELIFNTIQQNQLQ